MNNRAGKIIRTRRKEMGLTQEEAALELGLAVHQYQRYEYGESKLPNGRMRIGLRICALLELDPFTLIFDLPAAEVAHKDWSLEDEKADREEW